MMMVWHDKNTNQTILIDLSTHFSLISSNLAGANLAKSFPFALHVVMLRGWQTKHLSPCSLLLRRQTRSICINAAATPLIFLFSNWKIIGDQSIKAWITAKHTKNHHQTEHWGMFIIYLYIAPMYVLPIIIIVVDHRHQCIYLHRNEPCTGSCKRDENDENCCNVYETPNDYGLLADSCRLSFMWVHGLPGRKKWELENEEMKMHSRSHTEPKSNPE